MIQISTRMIGSVSNTYGDVALNGASNVNFEPTSTNKYTIQTTSSFTASVWREVPTGSLATRKYVFLRNVQVGSYMDVAANIPSTASCFTRLGYGDGIILPVSSSANKYFVQGTVTGSYEVRAIEA